MHMLMPCVMDHPCHKHHLQLLLGHYFLFIPHYVIVIYASALMTTCMLFFHLS